MRITPCQAALAAAIALNLLLLLCSRLSPGATPQCHPPRAVAAVPGVTVILRDFDTPTHDVAATARSFSSSVPVLVAAEVSPYPPVPLPAGVTVLSLQPQPQRPPPRPELAVRTRHVALVPDGARAVPGLLRRMRDALEATRASGTRVVAAGVGRQRPRCWSVQMDVRAWTVRYGHLGGQSDQRGGQQSDHGGEQGGGQWGGEQGGQGAGQQGEERSGQKGGQGGGQWGGQQSGQRGDHHSDQHNDQRSGQWSHQRGDHHSDQRSGQWSDQHSGQWGGQRCGTLAGAPAVLLLRTQDLFSLPFPLARPVVTSLSLQAAARGWHLLLLPDSFPLAPGPPQSAHEQWRAQDSQLRQHRALLRQFGVKLEQLPDGSERWHGCDKDTRRCFGTIHAQTPQYLLEGRWTPPCCLRALRATARHVLAQLQRSGVRHWLEGGSLLGAVRLGDIIPWDYDVDVGLYLQDVPKCRWLAAVVATGQPVEDPQGFFWEKAAEGEFFRVHFSRSNRLHVDLWPFRVGPGGVMTKDTWLGHRQDVEFPESLLLPLGTVAFAGIEASAPRDPRAFLEFKFGPGVVEKPEYPNPEVRRLAQDLGNKTAW